MKKILFFPFLLFSCSVSLQADIVHQEQTTKLDITVEKIAEGLGIPWGMTFLDFDQIVYTERSGRMGVVSTTSGKVSLINNPPEVKRGGQGGLLDIAVAPNYKSGDWIYFTYTKDQNGKGVTTLARAKLDGLDLKSKQDLLVTRSATESTRHFGSRITFDNDGHIFFSVGDRGDRPTSQDLSNHNGTIMRLKLDGSIPKDNPFTTDPKALHEIWSYGHRNPQGLVYDQKNNRLWSNEHGPRGGDEINLVLPGKNYGWPIISYGKEYWGPLSVGEGTHKKGMEQPKKVYTPSIAPGSLHLYQGNAIPEWKGNLFSGALKLTHINRVPVDQKGELGKEERLLDDFNERIRALLEGPDGYIYFSTDSGMILRIKPVRN